VTEPSSERQTPLRQGADRAARYQSLDVSVWVKTRRQLTSSMTKDGLVALTQPTAAFSPHPPASRVQGSALIGEREGLPKLVAWLDRFAKAVPAFAATAPPKGS
jgi:hypothetical protein